MYKLAKPIRCPNCGEIVQVDTSMILTSSPPQYKWECPKCGRIGTVGSKDDIITFENQIGRATSGHIQKADDNTRIDVIPAWSVSATNTRCIICGEEFGFDGEHRICPKCREAVMKLRETTVTDPKPTACNISGKPFLQQGWECPKCGAIIAPHQSFCPFCSKEKRLTTTVGTGTQPFYSERTQKDNLTPQTGQYTNPNTNNNNTAPSAIPDYLPFCSQSEYGRTNWLGTNTPASGQYTNPNTSTTISKVTQ